MRHILSTAIALPLCLSLTACASFWSDDDEPMHQEAMMLEDSRPNMQLALDSAVDSPLAGWEAYGNPIISSARLMDAKGYTQLAMNPGTYDGQNIRVVGVIEEICQSKGCWMTFTDSGQQMRVKFEDYSFFVPMDAAGSQAIIDGVFSVQTVPVEEERHYLEDAGRHAEAAALNGDVEKLTFMATSVLITRP